MEGLCEPILLGNEDFINSFSTENGIDLSSIRIIDVKKAEMREKRHEFASIYYNMRQRKGITLNQARRMMRDRGYFGAMMLSQDEADVFLSGVTRSYPEALRPALEVVGKKTSILAGIYLSLIHI